jgi:hypothetical protein
VGVGVTTHCQRESETKTTLLVARQMRELA